ncbi:hypothetical protein OFY17_10655 [Marinomonas sp. C2222]|uniref:Uncharacterized protein n=1 Tax=Marinomonas sargassi TaxID=2984494 RepID=A0ABT2YTX9_9GAMM|nr:hypothetical protein [Marinomonas sargassi]MCV2403341.1 hypothetical protein [Marinomonas sargassi]
MFWELIATVFAGIGGAGIALLIRKLSKQTAPKWLVPVFAGLSMIGIQIQSEYSWYDHQAGLLPSGVVVVKTVQEEAPWRPWSYVFPQTMRFIAADVTNSSVNKIDPNLVHVNLYFFERRQTAKLVPQVIDCQQKARAHFPDSAQNAKATWYSLDNNDPLLAAICSPMS